MENMETIKGWTVDEVCDLFVQCKLDGLCESVRSEEVDGEALAYLWENGGLSELGLTRLQETRLLKKIKSLAPPKEADVAKKDDEAGKGGAEADAKPQVAATVQGEVSEADKQVGNESDAKTQQKVELDTKKEADVDSKRTAEIEAKADADADAARGKPIAGEDPEQTAAEKAYEDELNTKIMAYVEPSEYSPSSNGYETAVCKLLHARADPNLPDQAGGMPLANAVSAGAHSVVALLLQSRVDPDIGLEYAKRSDNLMVELLTTPLESFDLGSVYNCYHNTPTRREARNLLFWARDRLECEAVATNTAREIALEKAEEDRLAKLAAEEAEKRTKEARWTKKFQKGTQVKLSKKGQEAPSGYDWSDDAIMPGDVGEVLVCRVINGVIDVFVKGPRGRTCSYDHDQLEVVVH